MKARRSVLDSLITTKLIIGVTGVLLFFYLIVHIAGNAIIFFGPETFNSYSHALISNPLVVPIEIGLLAVFVIHLVKAMRMTLQNQRARPAKYVAQAMGRRHEPEERCVIVDDRDGPRPAHLRANSRHDVQVRRATTNIGDGVRDLYRLEVENFSSPAAVGLYVLAMVLVGLHLWHGVPSSFQSLGLSGPRFTPFIRTVGKVSAVVIAGGFIVITLWVFLVGGRL